MAAKLTPSARARVQSIGAGAWGGACHPDTSTPVLIVILPLWASRLYPSERHSITRSRVLSSVPLAHASPEGAVDALLVTLPAQVVGALAPAVHGEGERPQDEGVAAVADAAPVLDIARGRQPGRVDDAPPVVNGIRHGQPRSRRGRWRWSRPCR